MLQLLQVFVVVVVEMRVTPGLHAELLWGLAGEWGVKEIPTIFALNLRVV